MVVVDEEVAVRTHGEGPAGVFRERVQHVVEKADAGVEGDLLGGRYLRGVTALGQGDLEAGGVGGVGGEV